MFYSFAKVFVRFILLFVFRVRIRGRENMPEEGGVILAVNHRSYMDPVMAAIASPRKLAFMAKGELFKNPVFGGLIKSLGAFPVHRGGSDVGAMKSAFKILKDGNALLIFPQGRRVKNGEKGKAKPGAAMIAQRCRVPVVPMYIGGEYKWMRKITVTIGKPLTFEEYYGQKPDAETLETLAERILDAVWECK